MPAKSTPYVTRHAAEFRRWLLRWFRRHGRDLPWRQTRDPYRVLVSEFMLQQTQVSRVQQYYPAFLSAFPSIRALAAATPARVRERWEGLGYYRRAANLHRLAQVVVEQWEGVVPDQVEALRRLPGIGRYTAGAVASFAFEQPEPAVDTNVARVIRRVFHPRRNTTERRIWMTAAAILPRRRANAWAFNQGIMELGAVVCTARVAKCGACPVRRVCKSREKVKREE